MPINIKNSSCVISFLLLALISEAQSEKSEYVGRAAMAQVFEQMNNWFKNTSAYSMTVTHASYENYTTTVPADKAVGYFKKDKNNYHSFLMGIHTIQNSTYKIVLDTADKIMMVANPDQLVWNTYTPDDYVLLLKTCSTIKLSIVGADKKYRIEFEKGYPLSAYEFIIDADGLPKEVVSYYAQEIKKDEEDKNSAKVKPRVSISFSGYKKNAVFNYKTEFDESKYFIRKGSKLLATENYKDFKFSDQRYNLN
jgi:hypothetical protein